MKARGITFINAFKNRNVRRGKKIRDYRFRKPLKRDLKLVKPKPKKKWADGWDVILDERVELAKKHEEYAKSSPQGGPTRYPGGPTPSGTVTTGATVTPGAAAATGGGGGGGS